MEMKKIIAIGVIFLFIGVAVAPSINFTVVKASNDNDLVEVTSQACGIQGFGNTTVKLTKQQYQNLEQYLVDFRARLNQTTTRDEAVPIFKDAVVELNKYGLLPKEMTVDKAQKLIGALNEKYQSPEFDRIVKKNKLRFNGTLNLMCFVSGVTNIGQIGLFSPATMFFGPLNILFVPFVILQFLLLLFMYGGGDVPQFLFDISLILFLIGIFFIACSIISPFAILNIIRFGFLYTCRGWIETIGLLGTQKRSGVIPRSNTIIGFTGVKIINFDKEPVRVIPKSR